MVENIVILGAGGDGRNIIDIITEINSITEKYNLLGFLDDDPNKQDKIFNGYPVLGKLADIDKFKDSSFITMIGSVRKRYSRKKAIARLKIEDERLARLIHPHATVSKSARILNGVVLFPGVRVHANVKIGRYVRLHSNVSIGHDSIIEDYVTMASASVTAGYVRIGEGCYIGINASIREGVSIGEWAIVGMGAVVLEDVEKHSVVVGNPARFLRRAQNEE